MSPVRYMRAPGREEKGSGRKRSAVREAVEVAANDAEAGDEELAGDADGEGEEGGVEDVDSSRSSTSSPSGPGASTCSEEQSINWLEPTCRTNESGHLAATPGDLSIALESGSPHERRASRSQGGEHPVTGSPALTSFASPAFRFLFAGRLATTLADAVAPITLVFAVLDLGGSPTEVGLVLASRTVPSSSSCCSAESSRTGCRATSSSSRPTRPVWRPREGWRFSCSPARLRSDTSPSSRRSTAPRVPSSFRPHPG